ncbi:hypothetical protein [Pseudoalteromonas luteoviolacea]|uniref:hypothetical protein n=1 Tax=Pseudoalteromonas luteoviolacea TaxID=43657 RepID=UPI001154AC6D|nr:hypothetical protein [Pseudoalteromonas luteoviolacea]TQF70044.1 hypothetical protein FLM44_02825 [Pseudoalteromonas luteoviolacea]
MSITFIWNLMFKRAFKPEAKNMLIDILHQLLQHLDKSQDSIWSDIEVSQVVIIIENQLSSLNKTNKLNVSKIHYLFLPAAPLQEIAIENGWHEEYLILAERFDRLIS